MRRLSMVCIIRKVLCRLLSERISKGDTIEKTFEFFDACGIWNVQVHKVV